MNCPKCRQENKDSASFCVSCGTSLSSHEEVSESTTLLTCSKCKRDNDNTNSFCTFCGSSLLEEPLRSVSDTSEEPSSAPVKRASQKQKNPWISFEQLVGLNWLAIIGGIALILGVVFFFNWAVENNWLSDLVIITLGIVGGIVLLGVGEYTRYRYSKWSQAITGSGLGVLYVTVYSIYAYYDLIPILVDLFLLAIVVTISAVLAIRYGSLITAILGMLGAFIVPLLLAGDVDQGQVYAILIYLLVIDAGILGVATFRNWRWFTLVGLIGSYGVVLLWLLEYSEDPLIMQPLVMQFGLTMMFLIFVASTTISHVLWRITPKTTDLTLMTLNAFSYLGLSVYSLRDYSYHLGDYSQDWNGLIALTLSIFYVFFAYAAIKRKQVPVQIPFFSLAIALVFLTLAIPLQLGGAPMTAALIAEAIILVFAGFYISNWRVRLFGLGLLSIALIRLIIFDSEVAPETFTVLLNSRFITYLWWIAATYIAIYLYRRYRNKIEGWEKQIYLVLLSAGNIFTIFALTVDLINYFDFQILNRELTNTQVLQLENGKNLAVTILWAIYAAGMLAISILKNVNLLRWASLSLILISILKFTLIDISYFYPMSNPSQHMLVVNLYFMTSFILLAASTFAIYAYLHDSSGLIKRETAVFRLIIVVVNLLILFTLTNEIVQFFNAMEITQDGVYDSHTNFSMTVFWVIYSVAVIGFGMWRDYSSIRLIGLVLMAIPVIKLFFYDAFYLELGFRVGGFLTVGILLMSTGFAYQKYRNKFKGFLFGEESSA